ncbi:MAG: hypothetical protein V3S25_10785 [Nitrospirales bacterium]
MATRTHIRSADRFLGKGAATDLSPGGWGVEGDHRVATGMTLALHVCLPNQKQPVRNPRLPSPSLHTPTRA